VRATGLPAGGMRGIKLDDIAGDKVVAAQVIRAGMSVWTITEDGIAKSTPVVEYPVQGRAGMGVFAMKIALGQRLGSATVATLDDLVVILTVKGKFKVVKFRAAPQGPRNSKGDYVMNVNKTDRVRGVTQIVLRPELSPDLLPPEPTYAPGTNGASEETA
jgi:DNA gyrase subunit A